MKKYFLFTFTAFLFLAHMNYAMASGCVQQTEIFQTGNSLGTRNISGKFTCSEEYGFCKFIPDEKVGAAFIARLSPAQFPPQQTTLPVDMESYEAMKLIVCLEDMDLYRDHAFSPNGIYYRFYVNNVMYSAFVYRYN